MTTNNDIYTNKATRKEFRFTKPERSHLGYLEPIDFNLGAKAVSENKYADNVERLLDNYDEELSSLSTKLNNLISTVDSVRKERFDDRCKTINLIPECSDKDFIITEFLRRCEEEFADWEDMEPTFKVLERIAKEMREG